MKRAALAIGAAVLTIAPLAHADDLFDARTPLRFGFAYLGMTHSPAMSLSLGLDVDVLRITKRLSLQLVGDIDSSTRPDLPDQDPLSSFGGFGIGAGLFYVTDGSVAFGLEATTALTFDSQNLVGGGVTSRAYIYPFYMRVEDAVRRDADHLAAWVRSSISIWVMARADYTSDGNGPTIAFGASVDMLRIFFLPYVTLLTKKLH